jgi:hypothetical protein
MRPVLLAAALWLTGCALPSEPTDVFDAYLEAYAVGDTEKLWELSSPNARRDASRLKRQLMARLTDPDPAIRLEYEGTLGVVAEVIQPKTEREMFDWAVQTIRRRLGGAFIRNTLSRWTRIRMENAGQRIIVVYRWGEKISRMPLARVDDAWRVDVSPFPEQTVDGSSGGEEPPTSPTPVREWDRKDDKTGLPRW